MPDLGATLVPPPQQVFVDRLVQHWQTADGAARVAGIYNFPNASLTASSVGSYAVKVTAVNKATMNSAFFFFSFGWKNSQVIPVSQQIGLAANLNPDKTDVTELAVACVIQVNGGGFQVKMTGIAATLIDWLVEIEGSIVQLTN